MWEHSVNRLILRIVIVALALNVLHHYKILQSKATAELVVSPLWHSDVNTSEPCEIHADEENHSITIRGGILATICQFDIITSTDSAIWVQIPDQFAKNNFLLYAQLLRGFEHCPYRFVLIDGRSKPCDTILFHQNVLLNLQGNVSLVMREISAQRSESITCFETNQMSLSQVSLTLPNCSVTPYHDAIHCATEGSDTCSFNFPRNCSNFTIKFREVTWDCVAENNVHQRVIIVYPNPTSRLNAGWNDIVAVDVNAFRHPNQLQLLDLRYNELQTLKNGVFNGLDNLLTLGLDGNILHNLEPGTFHGLDTLLNLRLQGNRIHNNQTVGSLDVGWFQDLNVLTFLDLSYNRLNVLPPGLFHNLTKLKRLDLQSNQLVTLDIRLFEGLRNLTNLWLDRNALVSLNANMFKDLESLKSLYIIRNSLMTLSGSFQGLSNLTELWLDSNYLVNVDANLFHGLLSLERLYFRYTNLVSLPAGGFKGLSNLTELQLHDNELVNLGENLFQGLQRLDKLDLAGNQLTTLPIGLFEDLSNLTILILDYNKLVNFDGNLFQGLHSLERLYLGSNQLVTCDAVLFHGLGNLVVLTLDENQLVTLYHNSFEDLNNLLELFLNVNQLNSLPAGIFHGLNNLAVLTLQGNGIGSLETDMFIDLIHLNTLDLYNNSLTFLDSHLLRNTVNLSFLSLENNKLQNIPTINHLIQLTLINLGGNDLQHVNSHTFSGLQNGVRLLVSQHEICECYVLQNVICSASSDRSPYLTCERLLSDRALVVVMWFIGVNALCGNIFVFCWRNKKSNEDKHKVQSLLLSNLAMADLLMGVYMVIIAIADILFANEFPMRSETWRTGITCKIAGALSIISSEASVFFITVISFDRFLNIRYPFNSTYKFRTKSTIITVTLIWLLAAAIGIVPSILAGKHVDFYDNSHVCIGLPLALTETFSSNITSEWHYTQHRIQEFYTSKAISQGQVPGLYFSSAVFLGINSVCYILIVCCYVIIVQTVRKSSKQVRQTQDMRDQIKLTAKVTVIVATDFLCWAPIIIMGIMVQSQIITLPPTVYAWSVTFILPINSAINPYLYTIVDVLTSRLKRKQTEREHAKDPKPPHLNLSQWKAIKDSNQK